MQGFKRRVTYVVLFEIMAIAITTVGLTYISGRDAGQSGMVATVVSVIAIVWNFTYNAVFEYFEAKYTAGGRSLLCRVVHAVGFEGGLALITVPTLALLLQIDLVTALLANIGLMLFFMLYAFFFSLAFDRVFGLPLSAQKKNCPS